MDFDDSFDFDDDGFDDLPAHALQELEFSAIRATQGHVNSAPAPAKSDYGDDDNDEVVDLRDQNSISQASNWVNVAHSHTVPRQQLQQNQSYNHVSRIGVPQNDSMDLDDLPPRSQADPAQLLLRVKKLEQEKARLNRDLQSEKSNAQKTAGEATTLRRRLNTVAKEHDQRLWELRQANEDALKKQKEEIQRLKQHNEQAQTNNMFAEHDKMADKAARLQRNQVSIRTRQTDMRSPTTTPRRQQKTVPVVGGFGDGFDNEDMAMASPSRTRAKSKAGTPKQANKRKRQVVDQSPIPALQLSEPRERPPVLEALLSNESIDTTQVPVSGRDDHRFQLLHRLVNNRSSNGKDRVLEALAQYALPSNPEKKLSSTVYDALVSCGLEENVRSLALKIGDIFLSLWETCLDENYYDPIYLCLDAIHFILACEPCSTAVALSDRAIPLIMKSVDLVSIPIADAGLYGTIEELFSPAQRKISASIDVLDCLDLLYVITSSCVPSPEAISHAWQLISFDFILVLVRSRQPLPTVKTMLRILGTSALPTSIGAIDPPASDPSHEQILTERQERRENELLERLASMLDASLSTISDPTSPSTTTHHYPPAEVLAFRLSIISLLACFSIPSHGNTRLLTHSALLGRLISFLHSQISQIYSHPLLPTHALTITTINTTFNLIYHLITSFPHKDPHDYSNFINDKLATLPGGQHKFMVSLTRIAFCEGLVLEKGIEEAVVKGAEDLLDGWLTGPEGEALLEVFEPGGTGRSGGSRNERGSAEGKMDVEGEEEMAELED